MFSSRIHTGIRRAATVITVAAVAASGVLIAPAATAAVRPVTTDVSRSTLAPVSTQLTLTLSQATAEYASPNQTVATVTVKSSNGAVPTGRVLIRDAGRAVTVVALRGGKGSVTLPRNLSVGSHSIYGVYSPATTAFPSSQSAPVALTITRARSQVSFGLSNPLRLGSGQIATVKVTSAGVIPRGRIVMSQKGKVLHRTVLSENGTATVRISSKLPLGRHGFKVSYVGSDKVLPSWTSRWTTVKKRPTSVRATITSTSATVSVVGSVWTPTGTVTVKVDGRAVKTGTLVNGKVTITFPQPSYGSHRITATYNGNAKFAKSSAGSTVTVQQDSRCSITARACIDLTNDRSWIQENGRIIYGPVKITSGKPGYRTNPGIFSIYWRNIDHKSSIFNNAPMPYSQFFDGGIAFHEGSVYVTSHGCIHLDWSAARAYWNLLDLGDKVHVFGYAPY